MKNRLIALCSAVLVTGSVAFAANPVSVDQDVAADNVSTFNTIGAAVTSFASGEVNAGETPPFVINVDADDTFTEGVSTGLTLEQAAASGEITGSIVIQSDAPGTGVLVYLEGDASGSDDGLNIGQNVHDVTLIDFIFASAPGAVWADNMVNVDETANVTLNTITFDSCVFSDVASPSGTPVVTDKASWITAASGPYAGSGNGGTFTSGDYMMQAWNDAGESFNVVMTDCVGYSPYGCFRIRLDGDVPETATVTNTLGYSGQGMWNSPFYFGGNNTPTGDTVIVTGTDVDAGPLSGNVAMSLNWHGYYLNAAGPVSFEIDNTIAYGVNPVDAGHSRGISAGGLAQINVLTDTILASNFYTWLDSIQAGEAIAAERVTIHHEATNPSASPVLLEFGILGGNTGTLDFTDSIVSGNGAALLTGTANVTFTNCDIVENGPHALASTAGVVSASSVFVDPDYAQATDPTAADYMDVQNVQLATLSSTAGPIAGGGTYVGGGIPVELSIFTTN